MLDKPGNRLPPDSNIIGSLFDLTAAEAAVARFIAAGKKPAEIAVALGTSVETVRSQLKNVFLKTSTNHQTELALLLANYRVAPNREF
ncbi:MAG: helix-turn-helix transcriptional regulator [Novosphingobium sp.]|nr:helix-turn-helix transcriptional regulator [Novosphingobium sp.]